MDNRRDSLVTIVQCIQQLCEHHPDPLFADRDTVIVVLAGTLPVPYPYWAPKKCEQFLRLGLCDLSFQALWQQVHRQTHQGDIVLLMHLLNGQEVPVLEAVEACASARTAAFRAGVGTGISLDISSLSQDGVSHTQNILQRSMLVCPCIRCIPLASSLMDSVLQVLLAIQWSTLQSHVFSGVATNEWIQLMDAVCGNMTAASNSLRDLNLQHFRIHGSNAERILLSYSSILFNHRLVYANLRMELVLEDVSKGERRLEFCS